MSNLKYVRPGVMVRYPGPRFNDNFAHWRQMHAWCDAQGWNIGEDFAVPTDIPNGLWYFRTEEQRLLFTLRWS